LVSRGNLRELTKFHFCNAINLIVSSIRGHADYMQLERRGFCMSQPLVVSIPHRLGREEAVRRIKGGLSRAAVNVPVLSVDEERWEGDRMFFRVRAIGQAASGQIDVADDHVRLEVMLPLLLQRFAQMAQAVIRERGQLLLTGKS
jgi:hypothetical protein